MSDVKVKPQGFTLIELLIVTTIIGTLSTVGVTSYKFIQAKARDAKRLADMRTLRQALELYYDRYDRYPTAPSGGIVIGSDEAKSISSVGITPAGQEKEPIFLTGAPSNTLPGGVPYLYLSKDKAGTVCAYNCQAFEVSVSFESSIGDYQSGLHKLTEVTLVGAEGGYAVETPTFLQTYVPTKEDLSRAVGTAQELADLARQRAIAKPEIQTANKIVAPVSILATFANFASLLAGIVPAANTGQLIALLLSQPFLFFGRKRRESWGTVYDSSTKVPVDLASVRLIDSRSNRVVGTKVTDKNGRYAFTARSGVYRLEVAKPGFAFPSAAVQGLTDDGPYLDIYHGTLLRTEADGQTITVNIPVDPEGEPPGEVREILSIKNKKQLRRALAMSGPILGAVVLVVTPTPAMLVIFLVQLFIYFGFKRIAEPPAPKTQGVVYDEETKDPIDKAVVRIFSLPYNKVLESRVTDGHGRYNFYVGHGKYYLTVVKLGYQKTETNEIDFSANEKPTFIASDLPLRKEEEKTA